MKVFSESDERIEPDCWHKGCRCPKLMQDQFNPWLAVFFLQRSDLAVNHGFGAKIIEEAGMSDVFSLEILISMESRLKSAVQKLNSRKRNSVQMK